jgi:hypothetical protein
MSKSTGTKQTVTAIMIQVRGFPGLLCISHDGMMTVNAQATKSAFSKKLFGIFVVLESTMSR